MAYNVIMPKSGMAMEEGTIVRWLKAVGDTVAKGEAIAVIETDKVTMELESDFDGTLLSILYRDGTVVKATETIAWIGAPGEKPPAMTAAPSAEPRAAAVATAAAAPSTAPVGTGRVPATPAARARAAQDGVDLATVAGTGPGGAVRLRDLAASPAAAVAAAAPAAAAPAATAVRATPLARRVAEMRSVDLSGIPGSGAGGRIRKADVESATPGPAPTGPVAAGSIMAFSGMRRAIAEKMTRSHQQVPAVTLVTRADVTELATLRERMNAYGGDKVSYTDFVLKAAAAALREFPLINSVVEGSSVKLCTDVNIGMAVALDAGLIVPVIRGADALSLRQIGAAARTLAARAREGSLAPAEYTGGTFTVTNLGMYGITEFTPIINLPESAILGVGAIEEQLRMGSAGVEVHKVMSLCLTHDHRHIDGAPAAQFLSRVRQLLESCYLLAG